MVSQMRMLAARISNVTNGESTSDRMASAMASMPSGSTQRFIPSR